MAYFNTVKKRLAQISGIIVLICLLASAGIMTYSGLSQDFEGQEVFLSMEIDRENCKPDLDNARLVDDSCYEYTNFERSKSVKGGVKDALSKTIVRVSDPKGNLKPLENKSIKTLPANTSLNLMLETYTVSRQKDSCDVYIVTIESFSATVEKPERSLNYFKPSAHIYNDFEMDCLHRFGFTKTPAHFIVTQKGQQPLKFQ